MRRRSVSTVAAALLALLLSACEPASTTTPTPLAAKLPSLSGLVLERTSLGVRPSARALVDAWVQIDDTEFQHSVSRNLDARFVTDTQGRYVLPDVPVGAAVQLRVWKDGYVHQCAAPRLTVTEDTTLDTELVSTVILSASPASVPVPRPGYRLLSGVVYRATPSGKLPLPSASVYYIVDESGDIDAAATRTDSQGRYLLCGMPKGGAVALLASAEERFAWRTVSPGDSTNGADIVLGDAAR